MEQPCDIRGDDFYRYVEQLEGLLGKLQSHRFLACLIRRFTFSILRTCDVPWELLRTILETCPFLEIYSGNVTPEIVETLSRIAGSSLVASHLTLAQRGPCRLQPLPRILPYLSRFTALQDLSLRITNECSCVRVGGAGLGMVTMHSLRLLTLSLSTPSCCWILSHLDLPALTSVSLRVFDSSPSQAPLPDSVFDFLRRRASYISDLTLIIESHQLMHDTLVKISPLGIGNLHAPCRILTGHLAVLNAFAATFVLDIFPWDAESEWPALFTALSTEGEGTLSILRVRSPQIGTPFKWLGRGDGLHHFRKLACRWKFFGQGKHRRLRLMDEAGNELKLRGRKFK
jgi:hypothetical protein